MEIVAKQIWLRIKVSVAAYGYEIMNDPLISDAEYDKLAKEIDLNIKTTYRTRDNSTIDLWFKDNFKPNTGAWIWNHPDLKGVKYYYNLWKEGK